MPQSIEYEGVTHKYYHGKWAYKLTSNNAETPIIYEMMDQWITKHNNLEYVELKNQLGKHSHRANLEYVELEI